MASIGLGDDVIVGRLPYSDVTIVDVKDGVLIFKTQGNQTQTKPFSDITGITLTGIDSFNEAEKLLSKSAGRSAGSKIQKQIDAKKAAVAELMAEISDQPGAIKKLKDTAARIRTQAAAYKKSADDLGKQLVELKKAESAARGKHAKVQAEANKMLKQADVLQKRGKKGEANNLRKQAKQLLKQVASMDAARIRGDAKKKRLEALKQTREAKIIANRRQKDWKKQATNKMNTVKRLNEEADSLEAQAKRLTQAATARKTKIGKLTTEKGELARQAKKSLAEASAMDSKAAAFPAFVKSQKAKAAKLDAEVVELKVQLDAMASGTTDTANKYPAAIRLYRAAAGTNGTPTQRAIIDFRLLSALDQAGWIDEATSQWMTMANRTGGASGVVACRPTTIGPKGDARNAKAIVILKSGLSKIKGAQYKSSTIDLLVRLMVREGRYDDVIALLKDTADPKLKVLLAVALLETQDHAGAVKVVTDALKELEMESLAEALSVRGKALLAQSAMLSDKAKMQDKMLEAALDFMRVATFFPGTQRAGESLLAAGRIMAALPKRANNVAAAKAYQAVATGYPGTPLGKTASKELKKLGM